MAYYYPRMRRFVESYGVQPDRADDIVQAAMISMYTALPRFRFESSFRSWLYRIVLNELRSQMGRENRRRDNRVRYAWEILRRRKPPVANIDNRLAVESMLARMKARESDVLRLFYYDDLSIAEMAAALDLGESAVKMRLKRAKERFARLWYEENG